MYEALVLFKITFCLTEDSYIKQVVVDSEICILVSFVLSIVVFCVWC